MDCSSCNLGGLCNLGEMKGMKKNHWLAWAARRCRAATEKRTARNEHAPDRPGVLVSGDPFSPVKPPEAAQASRPSDLHALHLSKVVPPPVSMPFISPRFMEISRPANAVDSTGEVIWPHHERARCPRDTRRSLLRAGWVIGAGQASRLDPYLPKPTGLSEADIATLKSDLAKLADRWNPQDAVPGRSDARPHRRRRGVLVRPSTTRSNRTCAPTSSARNGRFKRVSSGRPNCRTARRPGWTRMAFGVSIPGSTGRRSRTS